jgi:hypothetical protein
MEGAMNAANDRDRERKDDTARPFTAGLHPRVYMATIGFAAWLVLAAWGFAGAGLTDYLLVIVSGFIFVVVALMLILSRVERGGINRDARQGGDQSPSFRNWAANDFDTWQERLSGKEAAMMILLPIASAAIGMTALAIVFHIAEHAT